MYVLVMAHVLAWAAIFGLVAWGIRNAVETWIAYRETAVEVGKIEEFWKSQERLSNLLARTAVALKGPEPVEGLHSWHDLPEVAAALVNQRDQLALELASEPTAQAGAKVSG